MMGLYGSTAATGSSGVRVVYATAVEDSAGGVVRVRFDDPFDMGGDPVEVEADGMDDMVGLIGEDVVEDPTASADEVTIDSLDDVDGDSFVFEYDPVAPEPPDPDAAAAEEAQQ